MSTHADTATLGPATALSPTNPRVTAIAAWITTGPFSAIMTFSGVAYLIGPPKLMEAMAALGYPPYFFRLLGVAKLPGVVGLLAPRARTLREWAYAGFTFDLIAAVASHALTGTASHAPPALLAIALLAGSYVPHKRVSAR